MLGQLINRIKDNTISGKIAKQVFGDLWHGKGQVDDIIRDQGLTQITDTDAISKAVDDVITAFPSQVDQVRAGEEKVIGFLVGQVMKATSGKANPQAVNNLIKTKLSS
jgi:aspartyl-tRNA(Asn)/glutamyl-tRNA(Gln) amidotransferase subunit B